MKHNDTQPFPSAGEFNTALFEALPGSCVLLQNNPPLYSVLAATPEYLAQTGYKKELIIGKGVFEMSPENPDDPTDTGVADLRNSLEHVHLYAEPHHLPIQRYDIKDEHGTFSRRYWKASNKPVVSVNGDVAYIIHAAEDITSLVRAEEREVQIEGIEKLFGLFMHAKMVVSLVTGPEFVLEMANPEAFKLWGKGPEIIGKPIMQVLPELAGQGIVELFEQVRKSGKPYYAHELPVISSVNGIQEEHYFNLTYQAYYSESNADASGVFSISHDVTELVRARQRAQDNEDKYRTLFDSMEQGYCTLEIIYDGEHCTDYRYLEINPTFERHSGLSNALGKTIREIAPDIESKWFEFYGQVARTGQPIRLEEESKALNKWYELYAVRIGGFADKRVGVFFTDITERKKAQEAIAQSENNLRNLIIQAPVAMAILKGPDFVVEIANNRMYELWGRSEKDLINKSIFTGLPEVRDQGYEALLSDVYTTGNNFSGLGIPVTLPRVDGIVTVYINLLIEAFREADGTISGVMAAATDVTEQILARQEIEALVEKRTSELAYANQSLSETNQELQRSNAQLEEFAYVASHDLKEPVRKIQVFTSSLKKQLSRHLDENHSKSFNRIENASKRMGSLIDDLLLYSHVSHANPEKETVDLNKKVQLVLEDLELTIEEKKAIIQVENLPVVPGYPRQLQQMLQNLIGNALKYSKPGVSPRILISGASITEDGCDYHVLQVQDDGIGFESEYADKIFQMFTRLHNRSEYAGTGVGLSIVKKVVDNHRGIITAKSSPGAGAIFTVLLPK